MTVPVRQARKLDVLWFLPTGGDGHYVGSGDGGRRVDNRYLRQVAQAVDQLGYDGIMLPTGRGCEDALVTAASLLPFTERLRFLVPLRPGLTLPGEAARQHATLDRMSGGRVMVNLVCGADPAELSGEGFAPGQDEPHGLASEFLQIWRGMMRGMTVEFSGDHLSARRGRLLVPPVQRPHPPIYFGGCSPAGRDLAAAQADTWLLQGQPPAAVGRRIIEMRRRAAAYGRTLRFGIRLHLIVRETEAEAWDAAARLIRHLPEETIAIAEARCAAERGPPGRPLELSPNLWAGTGLVRGGAGMALVGDAATVAARLRAYQALGIDTLIASGHPHLEEAYRTAELLFPLLDGSRGAAMAAGGPSLVTGGFMTTDGLPNSSGERP